MLTRPPPPSPRVTLFLQSHEVGGSDVLLNRCPLRRGLPLLLTGLCRMEQLHAFAKDLALCVKERSAPSLVRGA